MKQGLRTHPFFLMKQSLNLLTDREMMVKRLQNRASKQINPGISPSISTDTPTAPDSLF